MCNAGSQFRRRRRRAKEQSIHVASGGSRRLFFIRGRPLAPIIAVFLAQRTEWVERRPHTVSHARDGLARKVRQYSLNNLIALGRSRRGRQRKRHGRGTQQQPPGELHWRSRSCTTFSDRSSFSMWLLSSKLSSG